MKSISTALLNLLATGKYVFADLWTFTLSGGTIVRWTSSDQAIISSGNTFAKGPIIKRDKITEQNGVDVATMGVDITAIDTDLINGTPVIPFIANHGLDGATVKLDRAYAPNWSTMLGAGPTGSVIKFGGKVTSISGIVGATASITVSSWMVLLNSNMPRNLYQSPCLHSVYDSGCGLSAASFSASGTVSGSGQTQTFNTAGISMTANYYALGRIVFTSGPNAGVSRTVKINTTSSITLIQPLPAPLTSGNAFTVYAGCDLTQAMCTGKFNNLPNYKATPNVPLPQTPLTIPSTTTTTTSGGKG